MCCKHGCFVKGAFYRITFSMPSLLIYPVKGFSHLPFPHLLFMTRRRKTDRKSECPSGFSNLILIHFSSLVYLPVVLALFILEDGGAELPKRDDCRRHLSDHTISTVLCQDLLSPFPYRWSSTSTVPAIPWGSFPKFFKLKKATHNHRRMENPTSFLILIIFPEPP